jgi:hypothetical protein
MKTMTAALLLATVAGCSTYDDDWAAAPGAPAGEEALEGRWQGVWISDANGHTGDLRCLLSKKAEGGYEARYHATYSWCWIPFTFEYAVPMTAERGKDGEWRFKGEAELGCWVAGGHYTYEGTAKGSEFRSTYRSEEDRGVFEMKRAR